VNDAILEGFEGLEGGGRRALKRRISEWREKGSPK
jgi:hypothetical protein